MLKQAWRSVVALLLIILFGLVAVARYAPNYAQGTTGYDISWPNCAANIPKQTSFGIVGITFGKNYTVNPCLTQEIAKFSKYQVYMNTGNVEYDVHHRSATSPKNCKQGDIICLSYNYGYAASTYAIKAASLANIHSPMWWLDVETENTWSNNTKANVSAIQGMIDAIRRQTIHTNIGIYSYPGQWKLITGGWKAPLPAWVATGSLQRSDALNACKQPSFTAQPVVLAQYTAGLDRNYVCSTPVDY